MGRFWERGGDRRGDSVWVAGVWGCWWRSTGTVRSAGGLQTVPAGRQGSSQRGKETWGRAVLLLEELWWGGGHAMGSQPGIEPMPPAYQTQSFNHWTTGKSLEELLKQNYFVGLELSADVFIIDG